jgi:hypothetical protein
MHVSALLMGINMYDYIDALNNLWQGDVKHCYSPYLDNLFITYVS